MSESVSGLNENTVNPTFWLYRYSYVMLSISDTEKEID